MEQTEIQLSTYKKHDNAISATAMHPQSDTRTVTSDEDSEKKSVSIMKSRITHSLTENISPQMDLAIEQLEEDHYLYRRGSTQVHVQTYAGSTAEEIAGENNARQMFYNGLKLISALVGMLLLIISISIKISSALTYDDSHPSEHESNDIQEKVPEWIVDQYNLVLYAFGSLWASFYIFKGSFRNKDQVKFLKSHQSNNRWLKGVIILFGMGIILKDGLTFISYLMVDTSVCIDNNIKIAVSVFQALYIMAQTKYIFKFSKAYIRNCNGGSSTGLMTLIAINLSTWAMAVIDETLHALHLESDSDHHEEPGTTSSPHSNSTEHVVAFAGDSNQDDVCYCDNQFCEVASTADTFLFPFLIEYSLVASCVVYIIWNNVGKKPPPCEGVVKPSYRFYGHYHGSSAAGVVFFLTIVFLILLGTSSSNTPPAIRTYFTEIYQLNLYQCFLGALELLMLFATVWGLYLFYRICRPLEKASMLDQVLLIVCVSGPFMYNTLSMIAVISGKSNKDTSWIFSLLHPLVDQLQCLFQLIFILYGLRREPIISSSAKQTAAELKRGLNEQFKRSANPSDESSETGFTNKAFLRTHRNSVTSVVTKLASSQPPSSPPTSRSHLGIETAFHSSDSEKASHPPNIVISPSSKDPDKIEEQPASSEPDSDESVNDYKETIMKIVSEMHIARPDALRFRLRDVMIFLLGANASIWLFMSLNGTAFKIFQFESEFFGQVPWTIITMIYRPLAIFYRMHSAGCLFEMWSFA